MEASSLGERRKVVRASLIAFLAGLAPTSVPFWAKEADSPTKAAFAAAGLACWAVALLVWAGMDAPKAQRARTARDPWDEALDSME